jgi:transcriptional regulator with XRE-family HTH domain
MSNRVRRLARAAELFGDDLRALGHELRSARLSAGLGLATVADAVGTSESTILRAERGHPPGNAAWLARHAAAVGLRLRVRAYPDGSPLRDAGQLRLIEALRSSCPGLRLSLEVPVHARPGDARAFDAMTGLDGVRCAMEFISRFHDCQAQLRSGLLKQADAGVDRLIFIVAATHTNRAAVRSAGQALRDTLPLVTRQVLSALRAGRDPGADGIAFI